MAAAGDDARPEVTPDDDESRESPRHGFRGDPRPSLLPLQAPGSLTVAISREAGARGSSIGRRVGRTLGWQVYDQELMEYIAQEGNFRQEVIERLPPAARQWADQRLEILLREQNVSQHPAILNLAR